jgi:hypothetical protein
MLLTVLESIHHVHELIDKINSHPKLPNLYTKIFAQVLNIIFITK